MAEVQIRPGGKLFYMPGPGSERPPEWVEVTDKAPRFLFDPCSLAEGVKLRDIFLLLRKHMDFMEMVIGNWCRDIVAEGLDKKPTSDPTMYIELSWRIEGGDDWCNGHERPDVSGIGPDDKGNTIRWAIEMTATNELADCEVKLSPKMEIVADYKVVHTFENISDPRFTLGHILQGLIWELSWHGSPTDRQNALDELNATVAEIEAGTAELIPMEQVTANLREKIGDKAADTLFDHLNTVLPSLQKVTFREGILVVIVQSIDDFSNEKIPTEWEGISVTVRVASRSNQQG